MVDPQGVKIKAFKAPTEEERAHHYLWRIERELPPPGLIGIFDRSHYEDVLVVRVINLVDEAVWGERYDEINAWEDDLVEDGMVLIKCSTSPRPNRKTDCWPALMIRPSTGSTTRATSTSGQSGPRTWRPTEPYWNAATPNARPGMSSQPIASGIETGPSPSCYSSTCERSTCDGQPLSSMSRRRRREWRPANYQGCLRFRS